MSTSVPRTRARHWQTTAQMPQPLTVARLGILARVGSTWMATRGLGVGFRRSYTVLTTRIVTPTHLVID